MALISLSVLFRLVVLLSSLAVSFLPKYILEYSVNTRIGESCGGLYDNMAHAVARAMTFSFVWHGS